MNIIKTAIDSIKNHRTEYFRSLPEFQELFLELMMDSSDCYLFQIEDKEIGYAIKNRDGVLIEYYLINRYIPESNLFFNQVLNDLSVTEIYCKSFDSLLLKYCLLNSFSYSVIGVLYRDYGEAILKNDLNIVMVKADLSSIGLLLEQDDSIKVLFDTEQQLTDFIQNEHVFTFYKNGELTGCGLVIRTHPEWNFCDLGVWVDPSKRGTGIGPQIILNLREYALKNNLKPSCGCAIENTASQRAIEKSGFVSRHNMIRFKLSR